jgi:hypothetical protein
MNMSDKTLLSPTEEFYKEIFDELPAEDMDECDLPELFAILDTITPREADAVKMRFGLGCAKHTYQKIADAFGLISPERPRQIILKALRNLRHKSRSQHIRLLFLSRAELRGQIKVLKERAEELTAEASHFADIDDIAPVEITIESMNISVYAYNCLKRACIDTLFDLTNRSRDDMRKVRSLGKKYIDEVEQKMACYGVSFKEDEEVI